MFESRMFSLFRRSPLFEGVAAILRHCLCLEPLSQAWHILRVSACRSLPNYFVLKNQIMVRSTVQSETFQPLGLSYLVLNNDLKRQEVVNFLPLSHSPVVLGYLAWLPPHLVHL
jgi:hypothetical protein